MAQKSELVKRLDCIQKGLLERLEPLGFAKKGRTLVRAADTDILQIVAIQAGPFELGPPLPEKLSHLRPNLYGKFTINLGVYVPEILERTNPGYVPRGVINDTHCTIRTRLSHLAIQEDYWWPIPDKQEPIIREIAAQLFEFGIPFLERFRTRDLIIRDWVDFNDHELSIASVPRLDVVMILAARGETLAAKSLVEEHMVEYRKNPRNPGHGAHVEELALRLGLGPLA